MSERSNESVTESVSDIDKENKVDWLQEISMMVVVNFSFGTTLPR